MSESRNSLKTSLDHRFNDDMPVNSEWPGIDQLATMAGRGSCREFTTDPVNADLLKTLCAVSLSSPTKSDLQQRDIIIVQDPGLRTATSALLGSQTWVEQAPVLLVFCGSNRRQRALHNMRGHLFANDHLDSFFNAAVDAGIALSAFVTAAEASGLGCCPVSAIRNHPEEISKLLNLPDFVFPVAGLAVGYPIAKNPEISPRLPLSITVHSDAYSDDNLVENIEAYDHYRHSVQPYSGQRNVGELGRKDPYTWSEDKTRQYSKPERDNFGEFIQSKGFKLT